ncbi:translocation/assembly module TamB domain-containing protein [Trichocoleus sp. FACHB-591]|uniref:translocation/assembly module TamB domain-containing protein n=1 Tax=Trichocoleus sp. FACHB-591 TaxID=2692872 RepID=UPI0016840683|nr:translocation/assembly module TamB [Trichocoleus sp. FACHB-591]MBD2097215.1 translocation/assembly module TamB domain-containing protein [Trichocoleus sp. FACHB-591]
MTQSSPPGNEPTPPSRRLWLLLLSRTSAVVGVVLLAGITGGAWWAWNFVRNDLAPLIEKNLSQTLSRPVELGEVERFDLNSIRFGASAVPATPTDPDRLAVAAVEVEFNPLQLLFTRTLKPSITLVKSTIYVEQAKSGEWISTRVKAQEQAGLIKTDLDVIRFRDAGIVLIPYPDPRSKRVAIAFNQVNGAANFFDQNQRIAFEVGGKPLRGGNLRLKGESQLKSQQTNLQIRAQDLLASDVSRIIDLPLDFQGGRVDGTLAVRSHPDEPVKLEGRAELKTVTAQVRQVPQPFRQAKGFVRFQGQLIGLENISTFYGKLPIQVAGVLNTQSNYDLRGRLAPVSVANLLDTLKVEELPFATAGEVRGAFLLRGPIAKPVLAGTVVTTKTARVDKVDFSRISTNFALVTAESKVIFDHIKATPEVGGTVTGSGGIKFGEAGGLVLDFAGQNLPGDAIAQTYGTELPTSIGLVSGRAQIYGPLGGNLQTVVQAQAPNAAGGIVSARARLAEGRWQALVKAQQIQLSRFEQVPAQFRGQLSGEIALAGTTDNPQTNAVQAAGKAFLNVVGGTVALSNISLNQGRWQALADLSQIQLKRLSPDLRGQLSGALQLAGTTEAFDLSAIQAAGRVRLSEGLAIVQQPLTASVRWTGQNLLVQEATAPNLSANGIVAVRTEGKNAPEVTNLNLNVQARDYALNALPFAVPSTFQLAGRADFTGRLTGTPTAPNVAGNLRLNQFALNGVPFEPVLTGNLKVATGQGLNLAVAGDRDRIDLALDPNNQPRAFLIQRDEAIAQGKAQGDQLLVNVQSFPLAALNLAPGAQFGLGNVAGLLSGNFDVNLKQSSVVGEVAIARPAIGTIVGDEFRGRFRYANGIAALTGGELRIGQSQYLLAGNFLQTVAGPQFKGQVDVAQGSLQDILATLQWFELQDITRGLGAPTYARAADVQTVAVGVPETPLQTQLRRFSEIETLLSQQIARREAASPLPDLADLEGNFTGGIRFAGSPETGISLNFDIQGQDWQWDEYTADQVVLNGSFENGVLTLLPLRFQSADTLVAFSGQIGGKTQSGQLQIENLSLETLDRFVTLPVDISGKLNATATLAGSLVNPQAVGELSLVDGTLNDTAVQTARGSFNYNNARLNFGSTVIVNGPEPLTVAGSFPAALPFSAPPASNEISLDVDVKNEGLALLNVLTPQAAWVDGQGQVNLQVRGTLEQPIANGIATFQDATFEAQALPERLTNVNGTIRFDRDRILVEGIQGQFSQGQVNAQGILPIFTSFRPGNPDAATPLTVNLDKISLNLKGLYRGGVEGQVMVTGTALEPRIGGEIKLANGQVQLPDTSSAPATATNASTSDSQSGATATTPRFNDLRLTLGDGLQIVRQPILNFLAAGDITLNGTLDNLRPSGTIRLRTGQVNLFTTRFTLARGYPQTAVFTPERGLDPILDIQLITSVPEVTRSRTVSTLSPSEVEDVPATSLGALQTVRIEATATGPASQLFDNLELKSSPSRSRNEIVGLLGGGFINTLGRGDSTLGLANLAGSALLTNIQGAIGNALGLSEFRLFPTIVTSEESRSSTLGLAAEASVDITQNVSASVLRVLTADQPTQFGLRYRLNEEFLLRGSTDLSGDSRAVLEYETRF